MAEARRKSEYVTVGTLDVRVTALEEGLHGVRKDVADASREIQSNTALTEQIQGAVEELKESHSDLRGDLASVKADVAAVKSDVAAVKNDTADIVGATKWISTLKRLAIAACVAATAFCTAALSILKLVQMLGWFS